MGLGTQKMHLILAPRSRDLITILPVPTHIMKLGKLNAFSQKIQWKVAIGHVEIGSSLWSGNCRTLALTSKQAISCGKPQCCRGDSKLTMGKKVGDEEWPVYLYVPNLIGYARVLANIVAFAVSFSNKPLFVTLYLISFICDELDGRFARLLNQCSTFGAVLDMVTDRVSTAALLVVLSHLYKGSFLLFLGLLALDISSHWLQMYSTFLGSKTSHKDMNDSKSMLLRAYYKYRLFMGYCCIGSEVLYLVLYILSDGSSLAEVVINAAYQQSLWFYLGFVALPGCMIKQIVNFVQMKTASDVCVLYDVQKRLKQ